MEGRTQAAQCEARCRLLYYAALYYAAAPLPYFLNHAVTNENLQPLACRTAGSCHSNPGRFARDGSELPGCDQSQRGAEAAQCRRVGRRLDRLVRRRDALRLEST